MKILVTGGTGVIGAAAIPALLEAGHRVRLLSRHAAEKAGQFPEGVEPFPADLSSGSELENAVEGCACILHIAGIVEEQPPEITFEKVNVEGTRALCAAATTSGEKPFFIFISSLGADRGESDYHRSKRRAEEHVRAYPGAWLILRPANVYGPGDDTLSTLLKMIRSLPAVPKVGAGDQPFQPLWYSDFGYALARAVSMSELAGQTLEIAGPETTTTEDVLDKLAAITGRDPPRLPVPAWLARVSARAAEAIEGLLKKAHTSPGLQPPINPDKLQMLLEGNIIQEGRENALLTRFNVPPTSLQDGLEMLADLQPEQLPGDGVGALKHTVFSTEINGSPLTAEELLDLICDRITEIMPIEFAAEPDTPESANKGATLTAAIPGRGNVQVRMEERTPTEARFITLAGHPLAGMLTFATSETPQGLRFAIEITSQSSNVLDWLAMHAVGAPLQKLNWRSVIHRVIEISGGGSEKGVEVQNEKLSEEESKALHEHAQEMVEQRQRAETKQAGGPSKQR